MRRRKVWIDGRLDVYEVGGKVGRHEYRPPIYGIDLTTAQSNIITGNMVAPAGMASPPLIYDIHPPTFRALYDIAAMNERRRGDRIRGLDTVDDRPWTDGWFDDR